MKTKKGFRLELIRDSLIGISYHLPNPEIVLFLFLDNLLLLHQAPLVFSFWKNGRKVYSSLKDPDFLSRYEVTWDDNRDKMVRIPHTDYEVSIHDFRKPTAKHGKVYLKISTQATKLTKSLLESDSLTDFFLSLGKSINVHEQLESSQQISPHEQSPSNREALEINYNEVKYLLEPLRIAIGDVFADSIHGRLFIKKETLKYPNIFVVFRTCISPKRRYREAFTYTAGLLLLPQTRESLQKWSLTTCLKELKQRMGHCPLQLEQPDQCIAALEQPLGPNSRSVSDLVFSSGTVVFGRKAREREWDISDISVGCDEGDLTRRVVEECIYPNDRDLFYVPIHVGGTPWMSVFTFTPPDEQAWHHNYIFYRDLMQKAAELIRQKALDVYSECVANSLVGHMKLLLTLPKSRIRDINDSLQKLAQVYPFPLLQIQPQFQNEYKLNVPGRGEFGITFEQNPFFNRQVNWKIGDLEIIFNRCKRELELFSQLEEHVEINVIAQTSHLLKFSLNVLYNLSSTSDPKQLPLVRHQVNNILKIHEIAEAIVSPTKRHDLRSNYIKKEKIDLFINKLEGVYRKVLSYIAQPGVSGNQADRMAELIKNDGLSYSIHLPYTDENIRVRYFEPCITFLLQGLISNAIKHLPKTKERKVKVAIHANEHELGIYLKVQNQTDIDELELKKIVTRLNSPGPDLVGITETHLVSKAFWGDEVTPQWGLNVENGVTWIVASALIAEVINET